MDNQHKNEIDQIERKNEENKRRIDYEKEKSYMDHLRDMNNIKMEAEKRSYDIDQKYRNDMNDIRINHQINMDNIKYNYNY